MTDQTPQGLGFERLQAREKPGWCQACPEEQAWMKQAALHMKPCMRSHIVTIRVVPPAEMARCLKRLVVSLLG